MARICLQMKHITNRRKYMLPLQLINIVRGKDQLEKQQIQDQSDLSVKKAKWQDIRGWEYPMAAQHHFYNGLL